MAVTNKAKFTADTGVAIEELSSVSVELTVESVVPVESVVTVV